MKTHIGIILFIVLLSNFSYSETTNILNGVEADKYIFGASQVILNDESKIPSFITFRSDNQPVFREQVDLLKSIIHLSSEYNLSLFSKEDDKFGFTHYRYVQTYHGIKIDGTMLIVHVRENKIVSTNGLLFDQINAQVNPLLNDQAALNKALEFIHAEKYKWEIPEEESFFKE